MDIYGQDIKLDEYLEPIIAANGEFVFTQGPETVIQDIRIHLFTGREGLFYDKNYKAFVLDYIMDESTIDNRNGLVSEVNRRINEDPRVVPMSAVTKIKKWDNTGIILHSTFNLINEDHAFNLVLNLGTEKAEMVIKDVNPY